MTVEPFIDGQLGPHVLAAIGALRAAGLQPDVGPFGTTVEAPLQRIAPALGSLISAAFEEQASSITVSVSRVSLMSPEVRAFLDAVRPATGEFLVAMNPSTLDAWLPDGPVADAGRVVLVTIKAA